VLISSPSLVIRIFAGQQKVEPGVHVPFLDNGFTVFVLANLAEAKQLAQVAGLEMLQGRNGHEPLNIFDVFLQIFGLDHKSPGAMVDSLMVCMNAF
jgi:hypothetical protein